MALYEHFSGIADILSAFSISRKTSRLSLAEMGPISGERVSVQNTWECTIHLTNSFTLPLTVVCGCPTPENSTT